MTDRLFGVETEYAIAGLTPDGAMDREPILQRLMAHAGHELVQLPDLNSSGGFFLSNGSRFYVDCGNHPEICTPECADPWDAVRYIEAGHRILARLASSVASASPPGTQILCFRCNVDYSGNQTTWGCHESYMHRIAQDALQPQIIPHLVTRLIYTGAGGFNPLSRGLEFSLAPRMAHFRRLVTESSTSSRGIWHSKSEPLCSGYNRLHVLCGESLCSETANFLKIGATALIVAMADAGHLPGAAVQLADPLAAIHEVAGDVTCKKPLRMANGSYRSAISIQRHYLLHAESRLRDGFMPSWAPEVCRRWRAILDRLEYSPASVDKTLDWEIKRALYQNHARGLNIRWDALPILNRIIEELTAALAARKGPEQAMPLELAIAPGRRKLKEVAACEPLLRSRGLQWDDVRALLASRQKFFEIDTRFGQLGPQGIFQSLDQAGVLNHRVVEADSIEKAVTQPPATGRARLRGEVIQRLAASGNARGDWQCVIDYGKNQVLDLSNPFASQESWGPRRRDDTSDARRLRGLADLIAAEANSRQPGSDPYERRQDAADRILTGDFAGAETIIRGLLAEQFMMPSSLCHLARVLLMTGREAEAREQIAAAWAIHEDVSTYVVARMIFFQLVFAMLDGAELTGPEIAAVVARIRAALSEPAAHLDWTILPMLDHLRPRLGEANYTLLKVLAEALSDASALPNLDDFPVWRNAALLAPA
ncbi:MAG: proteasome accessory factor PafA2 family protein [Terracidiphilus sp.]|jgi:proteasome accessory factor A